MNKDNPVLELQALRVGIMFDVCNTTLCHLPESVFAPLPNAQRGVPLILTGDPKGQNFLYCVGNSVIIRNIEVREGGGDGRGRGRRGLEMAEGRERKRW